MFAKQAQNSLKCSRINFSQIWQTLQQILLLENLVLLLIYWQNIITWGEYYSIQEVSRRILVVFFCNLECFCNLVRCLQILCKLCAKKFFFFVQKLFLQFILQFLLFLFTSFSCYCGIVLQILGTLNFFF
jgi:hypothetical protein